jgi:glycosyltransferase involved in cell wall biosynthesis
MKHLLAVSWEMPPMYGPRATQVSRVLAELPALGWRPTAICLAPRRGGPHWLNGASPEATPGVELVRVPSPEEWLPVRALWRIAPRLRDHPDTARVWVDRAVRAAARVAAAGDLAGVITFAQPWSDHLVGLRVHRATRLPWVAHFSDPWADSPYATPRQRAIWTPLEARVVRDASALVFVTEETADLVMAKYPSALRGKVAIVPHGFDPHAASLGPQPTDRSRRMRIVHAGRFYSNVRTPSPLLRALAMLDKKTPLAASLEVTFIGPFADEYRREAAALGLSPFVTFLDRVPPADAARAASAADVLLVVDAPSNGGPSVFLPSKLVDYLPFRKPILGLTPRSGASARVLARLGCPVAPPDDVDAIAAAVDDLLGRWRSGALRVGDSFDEAAAEFDIRRTARRLHDVMTRAFV